MPYPTHWRVTFGGSFWGVEEWSCSLRIADPSQSWTSDLNSANYARLNSQAFVDDVAADVQKFFTSPNSLISNQARLDYVKMNQIGPDGRYVSPSQTMEKRWPSGLASGGTASGVPQVALAVTLRSDRTRGPLSRGRFFLPTSAAPGGGTDGPRISTLGATNVANQVVTLIRDLNQWPGVDATDAAVCLVSPGGRGLPDGGVEPVIRVEVGRLLDTQRRRRTDLPELPFSATV